MEVTLQAYISMDGGGILGFHCPLPKEKSYCPQFVADETKKPCCPQFVADEARTRASNGRYETTSVPSSSIKSLCDK